MRALFFISLWFGGLLLVPSGAHILEMAEKLRLDQTTYFSVQQLYLGWALFGVPIVAKIFLDGALAFRLWRQDARGAAYGALMSAGMIALGLLVFFIMVQPANLATSNWATRPANWETLRSHWEYGHLVVGVLTLVAFGGIIDSVIRWSRAG